MKQEERTKQLFKIIFMLIRWVAAIAALPLGCFLSAWYIGPTSDYYIFVVFLFFLLFVWCVKRLCISTRERRNVWIYFATCPLCWFIFANHWYSFHQLSSDFPWLAAYSSHTVVLILIAFAGVMAGGVRLIVKGCILLKAKLNAPIQPKTLPLVENSKFATVSSPQVFSEQAQSTPNAGKGQTKKKHFVVAVPQIASSSFAKFLVLVIASLILCGLLLNYTENALLLLDKVQSSFSAVVFEDGVFDGEQFMELLLYGGGNLTIAILSIGCIITLLYIVKSIKATKQDDNHNNPNSDSNSTEFNVRNTSINSSAIESFSGMLFFIFAILMVQYFGKLDLNDALNSSLSGNMVIVPVFVLLAWGVLSFILCVLRLFSYVMFASYNDDFYCAGQKLSEKLRLIERCEKIIEKIFNVVYRSFKSLLDLMLLVPDFVIALKSLLFDNSIFNGGNANVPTNNAPQGSQGSAVKSESNAEKEKQKESKNQKETALEPIM